MLKEQLLQIMHELGPEKERYTKHKGHSGRHNSNPVFSDQDSLQCDFLKQNEFHVDIQTPVL
jgi:hypothetical protein